MINRCLSFMRTQIRIEIQFCEGLIDNIFGKNGHEIFGKLLSRLLEGSFQERFKLFIVSGSFFFY